MLYRLFSLEHADQWFYDYNATDVQLSGKQWDIRYDRVGNNQELPNELHCRSKDGGKLFQLVLKSPPEE
jgi:hypothetical protein